MLTQERFHERDNSSTRQERRGQRSGSRPAAGTNRTAPIIQKMTRRISPERHLLERRNNHHHQTAAKSQVQPEPRRVSISAESDVEAFRPPPATLWTSRLPWGGFWDLSRNDMCIMVKRFCWQISHDVTDETWSKWDQAAWNVGHLIGYT